jgi:4-diphosphocytidyl-2-C-methyl-D-erythritol kinase
MLAFPNCKINLGLNVIEKRPDGFHTINTIFYPVNWCDALEVIENQSAEGFTLSTSGLPVEGDIKNNIIFKAWQILSQQKKIPSVNVHLHKNIPMGAGLGGGSSDAAFFIDLLDKKFNLELSEHQKHSTASELGSDCAFFLNNKAVFAAGRGNEFSPVTVDLGKYYILLVYPGIHSNTREAFEGLTPQKPAHDLKNSIETLPVNEWKHFLVNDFDNTIIKKYPAVGDLKKRMYELGAIYASMSGSGSAVYGLFEEKPALNFPSSFKLYLQLPVS